MDISKLSAGTEAPEKLNIIIEIPQGSRIKYELEKESGILKVDRMLHGAMYFPFNYGFVPGTLAEDGDPLDAIVLTSEPVTPGCIISACVIGMLEMEDEAGIDTKIIAVPTEKIDPVWGTYQDIDEVPMHIKEKIKNFFDHYKDLEKGKWVKTKNFLPKKNALEAVVKALK